MSSLPKISPFFHHLMSKTWILFISFILLNWDWKLLEERSGIGHRPDAVGQDFGVSEIMLWLFCGLFFVCAVLSKWTISEIQIRAGEEFIPKYYGTLKETQPGHTGDRGNGAHSSLDPKPLIPETVITVCILPEFVCFPADQVLQHCPVLSVTFYFFFFLTLFEVPKIIFLCLKAMLQQARAAFIVEFTCCSSRPALQK